MWTCVWHVYMCLDTQVQVAALSCYQVAVSLSPAHPDVATWLTAGSNSTSSSVAGGSAASGNLSTSSPWLLQHCISLLQTQGEHFYPFTLSTIFLGYLLNYSPFLFIYFLFVCLFVYKRGVCGKHVWVCFWDLYPFWLLRSLSLLNCPLALEHEVLCIPSIFIEIAKTSFSIHSPMEHHDFFCWNFCYFHSLKVLA